MAFLLRVTGTFDDARKAAKSRNLSVTRLGSVVDGAGFIVATYVWVRDTPRTETAVWEWNGDCPEHETTGWPGDVLVVEHNFLPAAIVGQ